MRRAAYRFGRDTRTVRPISIPRRCRAHGSALFTRGETRRWWVCHARHRWQDEQIIDALGGEYRDRSCSTTTFLRSPRRNWLIGSPKRREIGHGRPPIVAGDGAARPKKDFLVLMRRVSEILESNGSSSMASVCGGSLALMDAGVPLKAPVAGIAMGLIKEGNRFAVLTDILGDEDHRATWTSGGRY